MKKQIKSMTGLRFVFAVFIVLHHFDMFAELNPDGYGNLMQFLTEGAVGVDFFFILSGFIISHSYFDKVERGEISASSFLVNRIFKLWPVYLLCWVAAVALYSGKTYFLPAVQSKQFWLGLFMLQSYIPDSNYAFWGNGLSWSVSVELLFYVAFLFLVRLTNRERKGLFTVLLSVVLINSVVVGNSLPDPQWFYYINPVFRLVDFLAGMLLHEWCKKSAYRPATVKMATILECVSLFILLEFMFFAATQVSQYNPRFNTYYYLIPCLFVIYAFSFDMGIISKFLGSKVLQLLGKCSFTLYMVHQMVLYVVKQIWRDSIVDVKSIWLYGGVALVISTILGVCLHYAIEEPANRFLRSCWRKWEANHSDN